MESLGTHLILEYHGCEPSLLDDPDRLEEIFVGAVRAMRATIVSLHFHRFNPHGVSGAVIISESHLTVHSWPEYGYAAVDVFTCGEVVDPWRAHAYLQEKLSPDRTSHIEFARGSFDVPPGTLPKAYDVKPFDEES